MDVEWAETGWLSESGGTMGWRESDLIIGQKYQFGWIHLTKCDGVAFQEARLNHSILPPLSTMHALTGCVLSRLDIRHRQTHPHFKCED